MWKFLPAFNAVSDTEPPEAQLALADEAILGFILQRHRLPCPDTNDDGAENRDDAGCEANTGKFPARTLRLRLAAPLNYGVHQTADTSALTRLPPSIPRRCRTSPTRTRMSRNGR